MIFYKFTYRGHKAPPLLTWGLNAVAQFERDLLIECTQFGLARAKSQGKTLGRPKVLSELQIKQALHQLGQGKTIAAIARHFTISRQTIMRIRDTTNH